ncbi:MAG: GNAT family N-acetyltransferase [Planctomycetota bacterium]
MERTSVGAWLRAVQAHCGQLCDKQTLGHGIAYTCKRFPSLPEVNQFREVSLETSADLPVAFEQCEQCFAQQNLTCRGWTPAEGTPPTILADFLARRGFVPRRTTIMRLTTWEAIQADAAVRILPARAMRAAFRATFVESHSNQAAVDAETLADAASERLDDPQLDMFVANIDGRPVGRIGLHQVGDIARVVDLHVVPSASPEKVGASLLAHALGLARRLTIPMVLTQVPEGDEPLRMLFTRAGFVEDGQVVEFGRSTSSSPQS